MKKNLVFVITIIILLLTNSKISFGKNHKPSKILILGDSHSIETFGITLHKLFQEKNEVRSVAICGASARTFLAKRMYSKCGSRITYTTLDKKWNYKSTLQKKRNNQSIIARILSGKNIGKRKKTLPEFKPNIVIISMGTNNNYFGFSKIKMQNLITATGASKCILIGPPKLPKDSKWKNKYILKNSKKSLKRIYRREKKVNIQMSNIKECTFIDSKKIMIKPPYGNIHYGKHNAKKWAKGVFIKIRKLLHK